MNKELLELLEKKKVLRSKLEAAKDLTAINALEKELDELNKQEEVLVARARIANKLNNNPGLGNPVPTPGNTPAEEDMYDTMAYRMAFMRYVCSNGAKEIPGEYRSNANTTTTDVGAVIPTTIMNRIIEKMQAVGMILPLVTQTNLRGGVTYPTSTVKPVATWVAEGATSDKQKKSVTGITFAYHKLRCAVSISLETDQMALSAFEASLVNGIAEAMVKALEEAIINGNGTGQPKGILKEDVPEGQSVVLAGFALTYEDVVKAEAALPLAYENNAVYVMTKKTFMNFAGQVDNNGQPVAKVNYGASNAPERYILGRKVICCDYLPNLDANTAVNTAVALIFDLKDYAVNTNYVMGLKQYEDNDTEDQIFKSVMLADGKVIDNNGLVVIKTPATKG